MFFSLSRTGDRQPQDDCNSGKRAGGETGHISWVQTTRTFLTQLSLQILFLGFFQILFLAQTQRGPSFPWADTASWVNHLPTSFCQSFSTMAYSTPLFLNGTKVPSTAPTHSCPSTSPEHSGYLHGYWLSPWAHTHLQKKAKPLRLAFLTLLTLTVTCWLSSAS